jgi:hypothetical protein
VKLCNTIKILNYMRVGKAFLKSIIFFFDKSIEFISKSASLKGALPNYTKSITKNA